MLTLFPACIATPNWSSPGTTRIQQFRAMQHDPYGDNDIAPKIVGGRPLDFQRQIPEPVRNQPLPLNVFQPPPPRLY